MKKYFIIGAVIVLALLSFWYVREYKNAVRVVYVSPRSATSGQQNSPDDTPPNPGLFICPEDFTSQADYLASSAPFINLYEEANPKATEDDIEAYRYNLLVSNKCDATLANMNQTVAPSYTELRFNGESFGPQDTVFDDNTNVWSSYYNLNGQDVNDSGNPDEELIFNFYFKNIWKNQTVSVADVAGTVIDGFTSQSDGIGTILYKFSAPDPITNKPSYTIFADTIYPDQNYGYLYVTKISSIQSSAYSVTYGKKFTGDAASIETNMVYWLKQDLKSDTGVSGDIGNLGVDDGWIDYLLNKQVSSDNI